MQPRRFAIQVTGYKTGPGRNRRATKQCPNKRRCRVLSRFWPSYAAVPALQYPARGNGWVGRLETSRRRGGLTMDSSGERSLLAARNGAHLVPASQRNGASGHPASHAYLPAPPSDWQRYMTAVSRHKWLVLFITALGTAAGVVAARHIDPRYSAKAILWIRKCRAGPADGRDVRPGSGGINQLERAGHFHRGSGQRRPRSSIVFAAHHLGRLRGPGRFPVHPEPRARTLSPDGRE